MPGAISLSPPPRDAQAGEPPQSPVRGKREVPPKQRAVRIAVLLVFWLSAVIFTLMFFGNDRIPDGTTVAGVQLGGLTRDEAVDTLNSAFAKRQDFPMSIRGLESSTTISSSDFGLAIDVEGTADSVAPGGLFSALSRFGSGGAVAPVVTVDEKKMADQLNALAVSNDQQGSEPEITYEGTTPVVTPGEIGTLVDKAAAAELIKSSFLQSDAPIRLPVSSQSPQVSKEAADEVARTAAVKAVSEPVIFKAGDVTDRKSVV